MHSSQVAWSGDGAQCVLRLISPEVFEVLAAVQVRSEALRRCARARDKGLTRESVDFAADFVGCTGGLLTNRVWVESDFFSSSVGQRLGRTCECRVEDRTDAA